MNFSIFVSCPKGLEYLLEEELKTIGLHVSRVSPQGVYGEATLSVIYLLCVWSRIANRVQLILFSGNASNEQSLYQLCHQFPWQTVFSADKTFAIEFHGTSPHIRNSMYGAQVVKDAIADHFRNNQGSRPSIDKENPQIRIHAHLKDETVTVSFDLSGYSLHQRGYRSEAGAAPLKENLAAAILIRANWPTLQEQGHALHDPFCGAGTLVIEAAMMAARIAPGLLRDDQSLHHWAQHQSSLWDKIRTQALQQVRPVKVKLYGTDENPKQIAMARANAERAGVARLIEWKVLTLKDCVALAEEGLVICNPPYGERLGEVVPLIPLYQQLGQVLHHSYQRWHAAILTSNPVLAKAIGLRSDKQYSLYNGALACKLYCFALSVSNRLKGDKPISLSPGAQMFANRLQKNIRHLQKWAKRESVGCYRVYDADLPEYAYAIDLYDDYVVLQEYSAPASIPLHKVEQRNLDVLQVVPHILEIPPEHVVIKQRKQQRGLQQYEKLNETKNTLIVNEGIAKFQVNLRDYLDTGLFLDHRLLRKRFRQLPKETRFLNCFCYTATASVHAALAGAYTTNVDLSNTYLKWAEENFKLNQINLSKHQFIQNDCLRWLSMTRDRFDVIFLDPPSFSNSKRMEGTLDIQRDHVTLIQSSMKLLNPQGKLYFSTNLRNFKLSEEINSQYLVSDMSEETIDLDFKRNQRIHKCFLITMR